MAETNRECAECQEDWYADGEEGQENCPACGSTNQANDLGGATL